MKIKNVLKEVKKFSDSAAKFECNYIPIQILLGVNKVAKGVAKESQVLGSLSNSAVVALTFHGISLATSIALYALEPKAKTSKKTEDDDLDDEIVDDEILDDDSELDWTDDEVLNTVKKVEEEKKMESEAAEEEPVLEHEAGLNPVPAT